MKIDVAFYRSLFSKLTREKKTRVKLTNSDFGITFIPTFVL